MKNFKEAFGFNVHQIRKSQNLTIEALAEKLELSPRQVTRIESGDNFPSADTLCKISTALKVNLRTLFDVDYYDTQIYNMTGKFLKPDIRVIYYENGKALVKSFSKLDSNNGETKKLITREDVILYLISLSQKNKKELITEVFKGKSRSSIIKTTPSGDLETILREQDLVKQTNKETKDIDYIQEKVKEFFSDKNKIAYLKACVNAVANKEALEDLKSIIKGMELIQ